MAKKVLIIEDSADIGESLKRLIELEGYDAVIARTGVEGTQKALDEKPDLILLDLSLPDMGGLEVARQIRMSFNRSELPIVCVSSYAEGRRDQIVAAGCNDVMSKTSFINSFEATLRKYLERNGS